MGKTTGLLGFAGFAVPVAEIIAFVVVGNVLGFFRALALLLLLSFFGAWLFRARTASLAHSVTAAGPGGPTDSPTAKVGSAVLAIAGAGLLVLPGFVTALGGLLLQAPPIRSVLAHRVSDRFTSTVGTVGTRFGARTDVIDVDLAPDPSHSTQSSPHPSSPELT